MGTRPREQRFHAEAAGTPLTKISWAVIMSHTWSIWMSLLGKGGGHGLFPHWEKHGRPKGGQEGS